MSRPRRYEVPYLWSDPRFCGIYHTRTGDPDLTFITTWCFDLPGVIGVTWLFTEIRFTEHSTTPNIYLAIVCIHELEGG